MERTPIEIARSAATTAAPYALQLAHQFSAMADQLRVGEDAKALAELGTSAADLEHFMTFLVFASEMLEHSAPDTSAEIESYRKKLLTIISGLEPALADLDLVEVADTLEHDVASSLTAYEALHPAVENALRAAA